MLEMRHVTKIFNPGTVDEKIALNDLSFTLNDGDFVTVIGGNGAGKSTMQNAICGTWLPDAGEILLDGIDLSSLSEHQRAKYLGRVYQDPMTGTAAGMQIEENLALAARRGLRRTLRPGIRKSEREEYRQRLQELGLGLDTRLSAKVGTLSGGQRQALTLLMATLRKPKLLLLDEHTAALDPKTAAKVMELTERMVTEEKLSTLMITHNMRDAIRYGNRLIMLHAGRIILDISGQEKKDLTVPELLEIYGNGALSLSEKNRAFYALTRQFVLHNTGHVVSVTLKRAWTMFFYFTHGMMTAALLGALWMLRRTPRGETRSLVLAELVLSALLVVITSAGIYEARYILPVWPAAAIHIAAIPHYVLQWYFARRHAKQK